MEFTNFSRKATIGTAVFSSISLKLCCWGPLFLTGVAGVSGSSVYFSWLATLKPFLISIAFLSLGFAFYQVYKPRKKQSCLVNCKTDKTSFVKSKLYVWLVSGFVFIMTFISYHPQIFHPANINPIVVIDKTDIQSVNLSIEGMTCAGCEENINRSVNQLDGILGIRTSHITGISRIDFDKSKIDVIQIKKAIKSKGYVIAVENE